MLITGVVVSIVLTIIVALAYGFYESSRKTAELRDRLNKAVEQAGDETKKEISSTQLTDIVAAKMGTIIDKFVPKNYLDNIQKKITHSGVKDMDIAKFFTNKVILSGMILVFGPILMKMMGKDVNFLFIIIGAIGMFFLQDMDLDSKHKKRTEAVFKELPSYIDLLKICVEAGMDLEGTFRKVVEKGNGIMRDETEIMIKEVNMGKAVTEALRDMSERIDFADLSSFITLVCQSQEMGLSLGNVLKSQSEQIGSKYMQGVREKAGKIPVLMLLPMVVFIVPAIFLVILGPAVLSVLNM